MNKFTKTQPIDTKTTNDIKLYKATLGSRDVMAKCFPHNLKHWAMVEKEFYEHHDRHQNITGFHGIIECDEGYNLLLDEPSSNLNELILSYKEGSSSMVQTGKRAEFLAKATEMIHLWNDDGGPSPLLLKLIKDIINGVRYLQLNQLRHRNLHPENILVFEESWQNGLRATLSNFSSYASSSHEPLGGIGPHGWRAPELNGKKKKETIELDLFGLGLIILFCIAKGQHAFGSVNNLFACQLGINSNKSRLSEYALHVTHEDLIVKLLDPEPSKRPHAYLLLSHPMFWDYRKFLNFLCDVSNRIAGLDEFSTEIVALNSKTEEVMGWNPWSVNLDSIFETYLMKYYNFWELRQLVRLVRNVVQHIDEYKSYVGSSMKEVYEYFMLYFPRLFIAVYNFVEQSNLKEEERFEPYFASCEYGES